MDTKRNDPCPCGSGKKYKKCCGLKEAKSKQTTRTFYKGQTSQDPMRTLTNRLIKVLESPDTIVPPKNFPASAASTEEAETPELSPPI